jgi:hypothetical protein
MNSKVVGRYKSTNVEDAKRGYWEPSIINLKNSNRINGHFVRPNKVVFKYLDFKKNVDPNVHVKVFNFVVNTNVESFEKYIINAYNNIFRDTTSNWCHNYMSIFPNCMFSKVTHAFCKRH